ncbi:MAG: rod shape-determining protein RodA [Chloroflexi bacterium]|nr:rod shape-determining protein RodA [Chloroflexota bacterium]
MKGLTWRHFDFWLFGVVVFLSIFGIAMIRSAIAGSIGLVDQVNRQMIWVGIGLVVILLTAVIDYHYWASLIRPMYLITFLLLVFIFVAGQARFGAARWLEAGSILIQPSELGKIVIILALADYFARNQDKPHDLRWIARSLLLTGGIAIWVFLQPNLSTTIVIMVLWFSMLWISGLKLKYLLLFILLAIVVAGLAYPLLQPYQKARIANFLFPDPNARHGDTYNVDQALITIGSGGWFGMGYGHGSQVQLRFLKVRHTDFIFSAMAEEFGFVGTVFIVGLLIFVILRCLRAGRLASDTFGGLIAYGFAVLIFFQTAVNIGVNLSLIPVTGLTLPFVSYGGSSLLSLVLGIGMVESVILRHKPLDF